METESADRLLHRPKANSASRLEGFSLLAGGAYVLTLFFRMYATGRWVPLEITSLGRLMHRPKPRSANPPEGFSLLEMMLVVTLILIVVSIATPVYKTCEVRTREAVLRDHLYTLRFLIDRFTLDNGRAPARLHELVEKGYPSADGLPTAPFTGSNPSADGQETKEDAPLSPSQIRQLTDWGLKTCTAARTTFPSNPSADGPYSSW